MQWFVRLRTCYDTFQSTQLQLVRVFLMKYHDHVIGMLALSLISEKLSVFPGNFVDLYLKSLELNTLGFHYSQRVKIMGSLGQKFWN